MKRFITLLFALYAVLLQPLAADASYFPQTTITNNTEIGCRADTGFITPAATTGDVSELLGSASKTLYIKRVLVNLAVSSNGTFPPKVYLVKRSSADSGGTFASVTVVPLDSNNSTYGTCKSFTANPTTGTAVGTIATSILGTAYLSVNGTTQSTVLYESAPDKPPLVLRGTSEGLCVNFNGVKPDSGTPTVSVTYEWSAK